MVCVEHKFEQMRFGQKGEWVEGNMVMFFCTKCIKMELRRIAI